MIGGPHASSEPEAPFALADHDAELNLCQARVASERVRFAFGPSTAHDEVMGHSCERCGRRGNPCSIDDPTAFGMLKSLNLCVQCHAAIRQMDVRACKWFRRYCTFFETRELSFSRPINRVIVGRYGKTANEPPTRNREAPPRTAPSHRSCS